MQNKLVLNKITLGQGFLRADKLKDKWVRNQLNSVIAAGRMKCLTDK